MRRARTVCGQKQPGLGRISVTATVISSVSFAPAWKKVYNNLSALVLSQLGNQQGNLGSGRSQPGSVIGQALEQKFNNLSCMLRKQLYALFTKLFKGLLGLD